MTSSANYLADPMLWDVVEEHFNEAEFLFEQWESALHSPKYNLTELQATLERRLEAHLDGLVVGGREAAVRILDLELENADEPCRAAVAALALLFDGEEETAGCVIDVASRAEGPLQQALARALILASAAPLDRLLLKRFREARSDPEKAVFLEILTRRDVDPGEDLRPCLDSDNQCLLGAALEALRRFARRDMIAIAEMHIRSDNRRVRANALSASLAFGSREAWRFCMQLAENSSTPDPDALLLVAILGEPGDHQILYAHLDNPAPPERILWTLGFCGTVQAGDVCMKHLCSGNERVAKLAAAAIAWIGGLSLYNDGLKSSPAEPREDETLPPLEEDDLDAGLDLDGVDDLPMPNRKAIACWWEENRGSLALHRRHLLGRPFSREALINALQAGALWRRHGVALELSIRTGGERCVSADAFSSRQRRQIAALAGTSLTQRHWH